MLLAAVTLAASLQPCAPGVSARTMAAVVSVESSGWPLTIHDNTTAESFTYRDRAHAEAAATKLIAAGHNLDLGLAQINLSNLAPLGLGVHEVFDPCANLRAGATILRGAYSAAVARFGPGQIALRHALSAYNSGSLFAAPDYVRRVIEASGLANR
jgi:type IV secretion system protein VirB1